MLRLVRYLRVLRKLKSLGLVRVFSNNLGDAIGVSAAVVRKDFSIVGIPGNKRGGYNVDELMTSLTSLLGETRDRIAVVVGCGRVGSALLEYRDFGKDGIEIAAGFDVAPERIGEHEGTAPIYPADQLRRRVAELKAEVAILTVPEEAAQPMFEQCILAGIRGVLNFTTVELKCETLPGVRACPDDCMVSNVNIGLEIETLFYLMNLDRLGMDVA